MKLSLTIDSRNITNVPDLMLEIAKNFELNQEFPYGHFDFFASLMCRLDDSSELVIRQSDVVKYVHLTLKNVLFLNRNDKEKLDMLLSTLIDLSDPTYPDSRYDGIKFSFTIEND